MEASVARRALFNLNGPGRCSNTDRGLTTPHGTSVLGLLPLFSPNRVGSNQTESTMNPENEQALNDTSTWVVDEASGLSDLETRLHHLEDEGFAVHRVFLLPGLQPEFVILACHAGTASPRTGMRA